MLYNLCNVSVDQITHAQSEIPSDQSYCQINDEIFHLKMREIILRVWLT